MNQNTPNFYFFFVVVDENLIINLMVKNEIRCWKKQLSIYVRMVLFSFLQTSLSFCFFFGTKKHLEYVQMIYIYTYIPHVM